MVKKVEADLGILGLKVSPMVKLCRWVFSAIIISHDESLTYLLYKIIASDGLNDQYIPKTVSSQDGSLVLFVEDIICLTDSYTPGL